LHAALLLDPRAVERASDKVMAAEMPIASAFDSAGLLAKARLVVQYQRGDRPQAVRGLP